MVWDPALAPVAPGGEAQTLAQVLAACASRTPDALALLAPGRPPLTYGGLWRHVTGTIAHLRALGIGRNDRVAYALPDGPEAASLFLAVAACATAVPLDPGYRAEEFAHVLGTSRAKALIVPAGSGSPASAAAHTRGIPVLDLVASAAQPAGMFSLLGSTQRPPSHDGLAGPDDVARVAYTSGSTARPKAVPRTQRNHCAAAYAGVRAQQLHPGDCTLAILPLYHGFALQGVLLASLVAGASVVCTPGFSAPRFFAWLDEFRPTWYAAVPAMQHAILAQAPAFRGAIERSALRLIFSSSTALPVPLLEMLEETFRAPVIEMYGMSETSYITCTPLPPRRRKAGSVGVSTGLEIAVVDDAGRWPRRGGTGEIVVRGPQVFGGYDGNPAANAAAFLDGWFRTGDLGYLDEDGYLFLTGKLKDLINRGGQKVAPQEVEEILLSHPLVAQAAVFPMPHLTLGEDVAAAVVPRAGASVTERELRAFLTERLAEYKVPRTLLLVRSIPAGPLGKVQRSSLAAHFGLVLPEVTSAAVDPPGAHTGPDGPASALALERHLTRLWEEVLGVRGVRRTDDFFRLGGNSLLATQLFSRIEHEFGRALPLGTLHDNGTVERLARLLGDDGDVPARSLLVAVQPGGARAPLFCAHPYNGNTLYYRHLARHLGPDQPVYAIEPWLTPDGRRYARPRVEELAARYVREIQRVQPRGPYHVGGLSSGGVIAFEIAQQLAAQGQPVALLALFDTFCPAGAPSLLPAAQASWLTRSWLHARIWIHLPVQDKYLYAQARLQALAHRMDHRYRRGPAPGEASMGVVGITEPGLEPYVPRIFPGRATLFLAGQQPFSGAGGREDPRLLWRRFVRDGLTVHRLLGTHFSVLQEPAIARQVARALRAHLSHAGQP